METNSPFLFEIEVDAENHRDMLDDGAFVVLIERYGRFRLVRAGRLADGRSYKSLRGLVSIFLGEAENIVLEYLSAMLKALGGFLRGDGSLTQCSQRFRHPGFVEGAFPFSEPEYGVLGLAHIGGGSGSSLATSGRYLRNPSGSLRRFAWSRSMMCFS